MKTIKLHPTFGAEILGVDLLDLDEQTAVNIIEALAKYGVVVFRKTRLDDRAHVDLARRFGELDDVKPYTALGKKNRLDYDELFDVSNLNEDGSVAELTTQRAAFNKGNTLFHVDSSFNPRRASYSLLRAHELPPPGTGGDTEYADTRTAYDDLPTSMKEELMERNYVACHSLAHSRKRASPEILGHLRPEVAPFGRHKLVQLHEPSGRMNLYVASHIHHIEGLEGAKSRDLVEGLYEHAQQAQYVLRIPWQNNGDLVIWDNTCVMHRATGGSYEGKFKRDMRRATVHDSSSHAWGLNDRSSVRQGYP